MVDREYKVVGVMGLVFLGILMLTMLGFIILGVYNRIDVERRCAEAGGYMKYNECIKLPKDDE